MAAGRTVDGDRPIHAVNAHFIRGGDVKAPIEYRVDRHRDGRAFANRQVTAYQGENELFVMLAAFQDSGKGLDHAVEIPDVPLPESLLPSAIIWWGTRKNCRISVRRSSRSTCGTPTIRRGSSRHRRETQPQSGVDAPRR